MHFFSPKVSLASKKSTQNRHWLFVQITDEPLVKSHLGLRLRARIRSWPREKDVYSLEVDREKRGGGGVRTGSCQTSSQKFTKTKIRQKLKEQRIAKIGITALRKSSQIRALFCLLEITILKLFFFFF